MTYKPLKTPLDAEVKEVLLNHNVWNVCGTKSPDTGAEQVALLIGEVGDGRGVPYAILASTPQEVSDLVNGLVAAGLSVFGDKFARLVQARAGACTRRQSEAPVRRVSPRRRGGR